MLKIISIEELQPGMFVNQVMEQTGQLKLRTKGLVKTQSGVNSLAQQGIQKLEIDLSRSTLSKDGSIEEQNAAPKVEQQMLADGEALKNADKLYCWFKEVQADFLDKLRTGEQAELKPLHDLTLDLIDSVYQNSNALSCLTLIKNADHYLREHSLNSAILMSIFAKHMDFPPEVVEELTFGALLMDVGMVTLPDDMIDKPGSLTPQEWHIIHSHVDISIELVEQSGEVSDDVIDIIANHHERMDGSGYPANKTEEHLSLYARMAAIVDCYDALTSDRPYRGSLTPTAALKTLLKHEGLDSALVQQFVKCIGVHPVGSLVKLKSGKLAIVTRANRDKPLSPIVMTFYSVTSGHYNEIRKLDLSKIDDEIVTCVRPGEMKINLQKFFREVFLGSLN